MAVSQELNEGTIFLNPKNTQNLDRYFKKSMNKSSGNQKYWSKNISMFCYLISNDAYYYYCKKYLRQLKVWIENNKEVLNSFVNKLYYNKLTKKRSQILKHCSK